VGCQEDCGHSWPSLLGASLALADHEAMMFEFIFGSTKYAIWVNCFGVPVPMGLYNRFVPERVKHYFLARERKLKKADGLR